MSENTNFFSIEQVQLQFDINNIVNLNIANNYLYLSLLDNRVIKINLNNPELTDTFKISNSIVDTFIDIKNGDCLIAKTSNLNYFVIGRDNQLKNLSKFKSLDIGNIEFVSQDHILIITSNGVIYESNVTGGFLKTVHKENALVGVMVKETNDEFNLSVLTNNSLVKYNKFRINKFHQNSSNFNQHFKDEGQNVIRFNNRGQKILKSIHNDALLCFISSNEVFYIAENSDKINSIIVADTTIRSFLLSQYHIFILTENSKIMIYNQLNSKLVYSFDLSGFNENFIGLINDYKSNTFWLYSSANIYEILIKNELKDIWQIMVKKQMFDEALNLLQEDNTELQDYILIKKAEYLATQDKVKAAEIFASTSKPFEEVVLLFKDDINSLLAYFSSKLLTLNNNQYMQQIILTSWIVELYMEILNDLDNTATNNTETTTDSKTRQKSLKNFEIFLRNNNKKLDKLTVYQIITSYNRTEELLYYSNLIKDYDFVLNYYINLGQWEKALKIILLLFDDEKNITKNIDYVYKYANVLLINAPKQTIETWIMINNLQDDCVLDYNKLVPSLLTYHKLISGQVKPAENQTIIFLGNLIFEKNLNAKFLHNLYLSLLISYPIFNDDELLILKYLEKKADNNKIPFDTDFILRLCNKHQKIQSLVFIYSVLENYEDAVNLCLDNDLIELATIIADKPRNRENFLSMDEEDLNSDMNRLRKKLWLSISQKLINKILLNDSYFKEINEDQLVTNTDKHEKGKKLDINSKNEQIQTILKFILNKSKPLLNIQDLINLFPNFVVIDNFKEEIIKNLENFSNNLNKLNKEMLLSLNISENLKIEFTNYNKNEFLIIEPKDSCVICNKLLITRKFFMFKCFHNYHHDCLINFLVQNSSNYKIKNKLYIYEKKLAELNKKTNKKEIQTIKDEIDDLLSEKCYYCNLKVNEIDNDFGVDDGEFD
ncbi:hypothetical protein PACTADRAFT_32000 [Pachysolen tannophilus NRRL Y-2460]|uniref:Uncharacterized protein n=1 Tax=Pachysolen tannophilus NRRL Y-2460 TaxID=669874 RepID=A0A1E4U3P8_PACTA|nr:hypothetical protein PACTADRAFT_32000 [Pachysolen tannophilus NRRL Y-2460]